MSVLRFRIEALIRHLEEAQDPDRWLSGLELNPGPPHSLWLKAVEAIGNEAEELLADLRNCLAELPDESEPGAEVWELYFRSQARSEEIFRECLELLGGLALRDRMIEEYVCRFADELISECAEFVGKPTSFAIPAFEDALSSTLRRVARLGFPDWHLWTLPLVAYEYGQVVVRETSLDRLVTDFAQNAARETIDGLLNSLESRFVSIDSEHTRALCEALIHGARQTPGGTADALHSLVDALRAAGEGPTAALADAASGSIRECLAEANSRMQVLVSDAFATFIAGPAYACTALILRLNPNARSAPGRPSDMERAATILAVLAEMDSVAVPPAFASIHKSLTYAWEELAARTQDADRSGAIDHLMTPIDAQRTLARIRERVLKPDQAEYSRGDWQKAERWGTEWLREIRAGTELGLPHDADGARMRDVLNAAWYCRLSIMESTQWSDVNAANDKVRAIARQLCDQIIEQRKDRRGGPSFGGRAPRPRRPGNNGRQHGGR